MSRITTLVRNPLQVIIPLIIFSNTFFIVLYCRLLHSAAKVGMANEQTMTRRLQLCYMWGGARVVMQL